MGEFLVRQITTNTMAPALERIKVYSAQYHADRDARKAVSSEKSRLDVLKDVIEKRESGEADDNDVRDVRVREQTGGESEQEKGTRTGVVRAAASTFLKRRHPI